MREPQRGSRIRFQFRERAASTLVGVAFRRARGVSDDANARRDPDVRSVLPDVLRPCLAIVFCGTAAGTASARKRAYYAGPGNAFWPTLFEVGLTPRRLAPEEFNCVTEFGLGLTDLAKSVAGSDRRLREECFDRAGLETRILLHAPKIVAFTSKRAGETFLEESVRYGLQDRAIGRTRLFVLPSPSGAARRWWDPEVWRELARVAERTTRQPR